MLEELAQLERVGDTVIIDGHPAGVHERERPARRVAHRAEGLQELLDDGKGRSAQLLFDEEDRPRRVAVAARRREDQNVQRAFVLDLVRRADARRLHGIVCGDLLPLPSMHNNEAFLRTSALTFNKRLRWGEGWSRRKGACQELN